MSDHIAKPEELSKIDYRPGDVVWTDPTVDFRKGTYSYGSNPASVKHLGLPFARVFDAADEDWQLPENWKEIIYEGLRDRLKKYRSLQVFMDICVRCGACADKCHFFLGSGDPKNMPVLRAELLRSVYRKDFTAAGKLLGKLAGGRELTPAVIKEWFYYFYQCTECRRCSVFCPYGIDTAEITMMGRELLHLLGIGIDWVTTPACELLQDGQPSRDPAPRLQGQCRLRGRRPRGSDGGACRGAGQQEGGGGASRGALRRLLRVDPHYYGLLGYLALFHEVGLDYTFSTYASEGGNFGLFHSSEMMKRLNAKIYAEAKRLGVKWIIGGECGHMWRVLHQYMDTMNGPADFLEQPVSPITGTKFENAASTKMVHICEFTADLIHNGKIKLDPSRNDHWKVTFHDSCNTARAMGILEEPRYILRNVCNHFPRDAGEHDQGADLLLRQRVRSR